MIPDYIKPQKQIVCEVTSVTGKAYWQSPFGDEDVSWAGGSSPRYHQWEVQINIASEQRHGYPYSSKPYRYNGLDINMGGFIARGTRGMIYKVVEVTRKSSNEVVVIVEDVYRTLAFNFDNGVSINPTLGRFVYFEVDENFNVQLDSFELSGTIHPTILQYIPVYLDKVKFTQYPILCCDEEMEINDIVAIDGNGKFVKANTGKINKIVGRVSMATGLPNEYVIHPIHEYSKIYTDLGEVGDIIYLDKNGDDFTLEPSMKPMYLKVLDAIPNVSLSTEVPSPRIRAGSEITLNGHNITFDQETTLLEFIDIVNAEDIPYVTAETAVLSYSVTNESNYQYGIMGIMELPSVIKINGHEVTINTTTAGQAAYGTPVAIGPDIEKDINEANVPNIRVSFSTSTNRLIIANETGGDIIIENVSGGLFASDTGNSGTGFKETNIAPEGQVLVKITHALGREILIRDIGNGTFTRDSGISSSDNGMLPRGIFYGGRVRSGDSYVVDHIDDLPTIKPYVGDSVHVKDSGNGEWVEMKYTNSDWVIIATEDSARTDADTISKTVTFEDTGRIYLGTVSQNSRISNISIVVNEAFDDLDLVFNVGDEGTNYRLIKDEHMDLLNTATYSNSPSHVYREETDLYAYMGEHQATTGELKIVISYQ